jgi:methyltransferase (TIGR00027 family)
MPDLKASRTALGTAYLRAVHQLFDAKPRILDDPVIPLLLGPAVLQQITDPVNRYQVSRFRELRSHVVLRSRFAEDRLANAVLRGIRQYVILGAGFDTFALRQPSWTTELKILEVDHSGTQGMKRSMLRAAGLAMPKNSDFANVDFEHESLLEGLIRNHISVCEPSFFSWLGVTMYLNEDAIDAVLRSVAAFPATSEIVFTFAQPPVPAVPPSSTSHPTLSQMVASIGEPFLSYFEPQTLEVKLRGFGFSKVEFLSSAEAEVLYYRQRPQDLSVPKRIGIVNAML